jgi:hypothetical protein
MGSSSTKWTLKLFAKHFLCVFWGNNSTYFCKKISNLSKTYVTKNSKIFFLLRYSRKTITWPYKWEINMLKKAWKNKYGSYSQKLCMWNWPLITKTLPLFSKNYFLKLNYLISALISAKNLLSLIKYEKVCI